MEEPIKKYLGTCPHWDDTDVDDRFLLRHSLIEEKRDCEVCYKMCGRCKTVAIAGIYEKFTRYINGEEAEISRCPEGHIFFSFVQFYEPFKED